jgi:23S rRNA pseudouridine1911/1915/1917 synthase
MNTFEVLPKQSGLRLDLVLRSFLPEQSRSFLQRLVGGGKVLVNGQPSKSSHRVKSGDTLSVEVPLPVPLNVEPEDIPLDVLYEDADLIVVNKATGMVVHPAAGHFAHTLVNALLHHCRGKLSGIGGVIRPGIVHRIDKGTSGCIVAAKTEAAHRGLTRAFRARHVNKVYLALCWGTFAQGTGRIDAQIGRSLIDRKKMAASRIAKGRSALTEYNVLRQVTATDPKSRLPGLEHALVELTIHTGRTHQIRVHMAHIGHPLVGDTVYGRSPRFRRMNEQFGVATAEFSVARPMLHAYKLGFVHPVTGAPLEFTAPVPNEFNRLIASPP